MVFFSGSLRDEIENVEAHPGRSPRGGVFRIYYFKNKGETLFASRNPYWKLSCVSRRTCLHGTHTVRLDFTVIT